MGPIVFLACIGWTCGEPEPYLRAVDDEAGGRVLQIASRTLVSPEKQGPSVTLLGVSHLGNKTYYKEIQKKLDRADLVLFEGVGFGDKVPKKNVGSSNAVSEMQLSLARSMGLVFQLEAIRYDRAHFRNSDLSSESLMTRLKGGPLKSGRSLKEGSSEKSQVSGQENKELMEALSGNSFVLNFLGKALSFFGKDPKFRALMKLAIVETLGAIEGDVTRLAESSGPDMEKFMKVLLEDRNTIVFRDLRKVLNGKNPPKEIVVFYGAAHMPDLEKRLVEKLGFQSKRDDWLVAFGVNPQEAGLSAFQVGLVREMIRMQIQKVIKPKK